MPVWHASVTVWAPDGTTKRNAPEIAEREAVKILRGVGGDTEWWWFSPALVGHLRVAITDAEAAQLPDGCAVDDAGESGPERPRTR